MKQPRKNKTNQSVVWPTTTYFTIKELHKLNPKFVEITLRVRLTNAINEGKVIELGSMPGSKGRPEKIFVITPVTQLMIDKATSNRINLVDNAQRLVNVISVKSPVAATAAPTPQTVAAR